MVLLHTFLEYCVLQSPLQNCVKHGLHVWPSPHTSLTLVHARLVLTGNVMCRCWVQTVKTQLPEAVMLQLAIFNIQCMHKSSETLNTV